MLKVSRAFAGAIAVSIIVAAALIPPEPATAAVSTNSPDFTVNVMAPLHVTDWSAFESDIQTAKNYGVDAVSVDVWWGDVEKNGDNQFDWSYYDTLFQRVTARGLKLVPIFSFHQAGGNVGDTYTSLLPSWLWSKYNGQTLNGITLDANGLRYKSEQSNYSRETIQVWADALVQNEYADFTTSFVSRFGNTYANAVQEINVSLGPAGELRYPSYNGHDNGTGYPTRGALQSYSTLAVKNLQTAIMAKYGTITAVNAAWGTSLTSPTQIQPPSDATDFFTSNAYKNIQYGKDLIDWYNKSLVDHGQTVIATVISSLGLSFPEAKIGYKVPGVHWTMSNPSYPRAAEVTAGLIQTSVDVNSDATGHGYANIVGLANRFTSTGRGLVLHFTCLEMGNENVAPAYSLAENLVFWVANYAASKGVKIKGENALSGGVQTSAGWDKIVNAFDYASYTGLTVLRVSDVVSGTGAYRFGQFIQRYRPGWSSLYVRGSNNGWSLGTPMSKSGSVWTATNVTFGAGTQSFKFDVTGDWSNNWGGTAVDGTAQQNGGNIPVAANRTYTITFNEATKTYSLIP